MSDRQSKNYKEPRKVVLSSVAERTRSKSNACCKTAAGAHWISSTSKNEEATNASAPVAFGKQKKIMGQLLEYSLRCKNVNSSGLDGALDSHDGRGQQKKRRDQSKHPNRGNMNTYVEKIEIEKISAAEYRSKRINSKSKIRVPARQELYKGFSAASSQKSIDGLRKTISDACYRCFSPEDTNQCFREGYINQGVHAGNGNEDLNFEGFGITRIDKAEYMKHKKRVMATMGPSTKEKLNDSSFAATSRTSVGNVSKVSKKVSSTEMVESCYLKNASNQSWTNKSSSFIQIGSDAEDMFPEDIGIKKIDEATFRNKKTQFMSKTGLSMEQQLTGSHPAASSRKNVRKKKRIYAYSRKRKYEDLNGNLSHAFNNGSIECQISVSSSHSDGDNADDFLEDNKISSFGLTYNNNLGVASGAQSKRTIKQPSEGDVVVDVADDSDSSTNAKFCSVDHKEFEVDNSVHYDSNGIELLGSCSRERDAWNSELTRASRKSEHCNKNGKVVPEYASKRRCFDNFQNARTNCNQPVFRRRKSFQRKMQLSNATSSKQTKGSKPCDTYNAHKEKENLGRILPHDANEVEGLKQSGDKIESVQTFTYMKHLSSQMNLDEAEGANRMLPRGQLRASIRSQKKLVSPFHSNDDTDQCDDGCHDEDIDRVHVGHEIKEQPKTTQVFSNSLADSALESNQMLETKDCAEEDKPAHKLQTHNFLPMKFRIEDEVQKEEENSEHENEVESLFTELDFNWALDELESKNCPEVELENVLTEETQHAQCSRGKHELVLEDDQGLFCIYCQHLELGPRDVLPPWVEKIYYESDDKQTAESSSFEEKGNRDEDMDMEKVEIEKIDESTLKNKRRQFAAVPGGNSSMCKLMPLTKRIDEMRKESEVSVHSSKGNNEDLKRNFSHAVDDSLVECIISESSNHSNRGTVDVFLENNKINSFDSQCDSDTGIASRTRSKIGTVKQLQPVNIDALDLGDELDSTLHSKLNGFDDAEFKVDKSFHSESDEIKLMGSYGEEHKALNSVLIEQCNKLVRVAEKHASERRCVANPQRKMQLNNATLSKETKGSKTCKTKDIHKKRENISRILQHDTSEDGLKHRQGDNRGNAQTFAHLKHLVPQMNCDKVKGTNRMPPLDQSQAGIRHAKKPVSPAQSNDDFYQGKDVNHDNDYDGVGDRIHKNERVDAGHVIKQQSKEKQVFSKQYDFCKMLADSVLERDQILEKKECGEEDKQAQEPQTHSALPLKFRFEDEVPNEVEKSEYEIEIDNLFAELDFNWALEELGSFNCLEIDQENSPAEETPHERCSRGKHELVLEDDQGLICIYCGHVALGPKDVLPQWAEKIYYESGRKRMSETEELLDFDALGLQSLMDNSADLSHGVNGSVWNIKPGVRESMYEHQQEGFEFLWKNLAGSINITELKSTHPCRVGGCIISHAPGTGKTRLTIVFLETFLRMFPNCRPVIIAPAGMLLTWEEEFKKWNVDFPFHNLNNLEFLGKENQSALKLLAGAKRQNKDAIRMVKIYSWSTGGSILGISYSLFEKLTGETYIKKDKKRTRTIIDKKGEALRKILLEKPGLVVLDEGHTPRNQRSNIWNVLLKLKTERRVILSGTPFQNSFAELFNTLRIVRPAIANALAQEKTFAEMTARRKSSRKHYEETFQSTLTTEVIDRAVEKLKISMSPFVHVHKGTILQQSLPGLRDCVILLNPPPLQKSLIDRLEGLPSTFKFEHEVALISVHPSLFQHCDSTGEKRTGIDMEEVEASKLNPNEGAKTKFVLEFVRLSMVMNEKVLIFSQYIQPLELLKEQLKEIFKLIVGKQILQLHGKLDQKQRQILINAFNDPQSESKIMLASTRCCSEGISLVGASRVILLDVVWNPSVERQAICRAYRIGQKKFVHTYHLMTSGTTEADKYCRQAEKERLSELVFSSSSNESSIQKHDLLGIEDRILEEMVAHAKLKEMFEKIINQPKDTNLIQTFGLTS